MFRNLKLKSLTSKKSYNMMQFEARVVYIILYYGYDQALHDFNMYKNV